MANLFGTGINQIPTNGMLGNLAFQDKSFVSVDKIGIGTTAVDTGTANQTLQNYGGAYVSGSVGIGITTPGATLDVSGTSRFGASAGRRADIDTTGRLTLAYGDNSNQSNLTLQNATDLGSTTNHGSHILWQFGTNTTTTALNAGRINILKEQQWTTTSSTQNAYFSIDLTLNGGIGERVRVTSSGSVGIGSTNPGSKLAVVGDAYVSGVVTATSFFGSGANLTGLVPNTVTASSASTPQFIGFLTTSSGVTSSILASSTLTYIPSSGNLGIGTNNPTSKLQIVGDVLISGITTTTRLNVGTGGTIINTTSGGLVGIGTASPAFTADIGGDARVTSTNKMRFGGTAGTTNFYIQYNSTANSLDFVAG